MSDARTITKSEQSNDTPLLQAKGVRKYFDADTGFLDRLLGEPQQVKAVDGVDLRINRQETVGLVGESGCGKTTLGRVLSRLYEPTGGVIEFDGEDIGHLDGAELKQLRKRVQVIFQDPLSSLNPRKTVREIVQKPIEVHDIATGQEKRDRVVELFEEVGLGAEFLDRYPHEFSGGQRQRIGIARALAVEPDLIIADEPVSALDVSVQAQIINLMKRLQGEYGLSYLFIAHDLSVVKHISDRVLVMYLGQIVEEGPTNAIYNYPQHPYTRALLQSIPSVESTQKRRKNVIEGNPPSPIDTPSGCAFHTRCPEYIGGECDGTNPELTSVDDATGAIAPPKGVDTPAGERATVEARFEGEHRAACHWLGHALEERRAQSPYETAGKQ